MPEHQTWYTKQSYSYCSKNPEIKQVNFVVQTMNSGDTSLLKKIVSTPTPQNLYASNYETAVNDYIIPENNGNMQLSAPLNPAYTFDTFVVGKTNEFAYAAARKVAESKSVSFNPLFLYSGVGLGKTHLMHAIAWHIRRQDPSRNVIYLSAEQFYINSLKLCVIKTRRLSRSNFVR